MKRTLLILGFLTIAMSAFSQDIYTVSTKTVKAKVPATLWGLFFEDINRAADGGVYAEMVENRSFDFPKPMTAWQTWPRPQLRDGILMVINQSAVNAADPKYMQVSLNAKDTVGLMNSGFDEGMSFKKGLAYNLTLRYRQVAPGIHVRIFLFSAKNQVIGRTSLVLKDSKEWVNQEVSVTPTDSARTGKLLVIFEGAGKLDMDRISLFPSDTWKNRKGGLRADLVQKLADLKPGFLRFPGGCIVEGNQIVHRYQWKHTIGNLEDREPVQSIWADDVPERQTPDYMESFGLGFYEYFQACEDIKAEPLPIINVGMSCQFDAAEVVPTNELEPYITDALDLVEFANGDINTYWGKKRAELGHPAPFNMKLLGVGNENWGPQYAEHLKLFTDRLKAKYPEVKLINATGYSRNIPVFTYMDSVLRARKADIIDEHFYDTPKWFMDNSNRYDTYDRNGPKIFVGEYAAQSDRIGSMKNKNNLLTALSEACFMTGIERNADVVSMASYAPLFAHVTGWQWTPNLIWFDNTTSYNTPNYYVQQLFSVNKGTDVVPLLKDGKAICGQDSCWASAVIDRNANALIIKLVNMSGSVRSESIRLDAGVTGEAQWTSLANPNAGVVNTIARPDAIQPETKIFTVKGKEFKFSAPPFSLNILVLKLNGVAPEGPAGSKP
ncbi:alpha-L-arabinofuranosidase [Mucilaginibacter sp. BJC16-A38]|uniref:alpha-L-arabinofuranosidase C-terminal domain-containing protein n=1 Tax=Mucilaginibacter phenanthrenivorans TaxID=1234842 RepID=UPI002157717D|nr:alpha-L-arabinofuranosidase C-terminal domain-containing protein [Mucilaginibacter phenanthrenivorans]MCR8556927.1 alpha-L-arabinofuranosidase [Mucilaginibacter phenanthrenivorans]